MTAAQTIDRALGILLVLLGGLVVLVEWHVMAGPAALLRDLAVVLVTGLLVLRVRRGRRIFALVALALTLALVATRGDWWEVLSRAFASAGFIAAFFCALSTLRSAAETAPAIRRSGQFLAMQPPGRRYLVLTLGGQLFAMLLNYGSIALLGALAMASADEEPDEEIRRHRKRRMLLAIQRGFISTLPWSPLSFAIAITTALVPGATWTLLVLPSLVTSVIMAGTGWALDTLFKPRLGRPARPARTPEGGWSSLLPLGLLLLLLGVTVITLYETTEVRVVGIVLLVVPSIATGWIALQALSGGGPLGVRLKDYALVTLPSYRDELQLLMMAGYIGTVGAPLLTPVLAGAGLDLAALPAWVILAGLVWVIPLGGQLGMNPILIVTLLVPLLPAPEAIGVSPTALVLAITAGWALSGATSPFTATTLLIGSFGGVSASHVGLRWNGLYALVTGLLLSGWVTLHAALFG